MRVRAGLLVSSFDLFNVADLDLIAQARNICDRLAVAVLSDEAVERATGWPPVVPLSGRLALMRHVRGVDDVLVAEPDLERYGAESDVVVMGSPLADRLTPADVVLVTVRQSQSELLRQLAPVAGEGVA